MYIKGENTEYTRVQMPFLNSKPIIPLLQSYFISGEVSFPSLQYVMALSTFNFYEDNFFLHEYTREEKSLEPEHKKHFPFHKPTLGPHFMNGEETNTYTKRDTE